MMPFCRSHNIYFYFEECKNISIQYVQKETDIKHKTEQVSVGSKNLSQAASFFLCSFALKCSFKDRTHDGTFGVTARK